MQPIVSDAPYRFVPPRHSRFWHALVRMTLRGRLRRTYGVASLECRGAEKLRTSLRAGRGVVLCSNHCRPCDPFVLDFLGRETGSAAFIVSNRHLFEGSRIERFLLPRIGAFSVHREGVDRDSLKCSVRTVVEGKHPLLIFGEGFITRCNDRLMEIMEGPAFIARAAAKQKGNIGPPVIHPVFIRYFFDGDLDAAVEPVLADIEHRLTWSSGAGMPLRERISRIGGALLSLKEIDHLGAPGAGSLSDRVAGLIEGILRPMEKQWSKGRGDGSTMARVKRLRSAILHGMTPENTPSQERAARWKQLADLYLVQQLLCYPAGYLDGEATPERILETVERYEEDLTDVARPHLPLRAVVTVGDAIPVEASSEIEDVNQRITTSLHEMLVESKTLRRA